MTGRLAARAAETEALLAQFNEASASAIEALDRGDTDALDRALDVRATLQQEIDRANRELDAARARFGVTRSGPLADRAMARYCAPLEELARVALLLQERLEGSARTARDALLAEMASLDANAGVAYHYASNDARAPHRLDVVL
jgi:hypothetical protein